MSTRYDVFALGSRGRIPGCSFVTRRLRSTRSLRASLPVRRPAQSSRERRAALKNDRKIYRHNRKCLHKLQAKLTVFTGEAHNLLRDVIGRLTLVIDSTHSDPVWLVRGLA